MLVDLLEEFRSVYTNYQKAREGWAVFDDAYQPGISGSDLNQLEKVWGRPIPDVLKELYFWRNGGILDESRRFKRHIYFCIKNHVCPGFYSIRDAVAISRNVIPRILADAGKPETLWSPGWFPFIGDVEGMQFWFLETSYGAATQRVFYWNDSELEMVPVYENLGDVFKETIQFYAT